MVLGQCGSLFCPLFKKTVTVHIGHILKRGLLLSSKRLHEQS